MQRSLGRHSRWPGVKVVALVGVVAVAGFVWWALTPEVRYIMCDGAYPVWMLEAQDYDGGGCVEVLPSSEAPPNADWRSYCVGMCDPAEHPANQEHEFRDWGP